MSKKCKCGKPIHDNDEKHRDYPDNTAEYLFFRNCYDCAVEIAGNSDLGGVALKCSKNNCPNYCEDVYVDIEDRENYPAYFEHIDEDDNALCLDCFEKYEEECEEYNGARVIRYREDDQEQEYSGSEEGEEYE